MFTRSLTNMIKNIIVLFMILMVTICCLSGCSSKEEVVFNDIKLNDGILTFGEADPSAPNEFYDWTIMSKANQEGFEKGYPYGSWDYTVFAGQSDPIHVSNRFTAEIKFTMPEEIYDDSRVYIGFTNSGYDLPDDKCVYAFLGMSQYIAIYQGINYNRDSWGCDAFIPNDHIDKYPIHEAYAGKPVKIKIESYNGADIDIQIFVDGDLVIEKNQLHTTHDEYMISDASFRICGINITLSDVTYSSRSNLGKYQFAIDTAKMVLLGLLELVLIVVAVVLLFGAGRRVAAWITRLNDFAPFDILNNTSIIPTLFVYGLVIAAVFGFNRNTPENVDQIIHRISQICDVNLPYIDPKHYIFFIVGGLVVSGLLYIHILRWCFGDFKYFFQINIALIGCGIFYGIAIAILLLILISILGELIGLAIVIGFMLFAGAAHDIKTDEPASDSAITASDAEAGGSNKFPSHLRAKDDSRKVIIFVSSSYEDRAIYQDEDGNYITIIRYNNGTIDYMSTDNEIFY